jgi:hypothetical protein
VKVEILNHLLDKWSGFYKNGCKKEELDVFKGSERTLTENDQLFLTIVAYRYQNQVLEVSNFLRRKRFKVPPIEQVFFLRPYMISFT